MKKIVRFSKFFNINIFNFFCFPSFFQFWRLITNFLFFGTIGFNFFFNMIFTYPLESINVRPRMFSNKVCTLCLFRSPWTGVSKSHTRPMSHNVTPFFTDQFIFRNILEHFFPTKREALVCIWAHSKDKIWKRKKKSFKRSNIPFSGL